MTKEKVELKYVAGKATDYPFLDNSGYWELSVKNELLTKQSIRLPNETAMVIAIAIATARTIGKKEGYAEAKKRYEAINKAAGSMDYLLPTHDTEHNWRKLYGYE